MFTSVFPTTQLYGEFADHFKLSECKLAIIHCAGHSDPILVHSLWQEILEKGKLMHHSPVEDYCRLFLCIPLTPRVFCPAELGDSVAMSPADRMRSLNLKLVSLGKIYAGTPRYFPLGMLQLYSSFKIVVYKLCIFSACFMQACPRGAVLF